MSTLLTHRYDTMPYNRCGNSGLLLPAISLGLWHTFDSGTPYQHSKDMLLRAFDLGITHFDIANNYGPPPGFAEEVFGKIYKDHLTSHRDELIIASKAGYRMWDGPYGEWGSKKNLIASADRSLQRTGVEYFDIFYHHRPDPNTPLEETMEALALLLQQGKALYVGVSNYNAEQTQAACEVAKEYGVRLLIHQVNYSLFRRQPEEGLLSVLNDNGVGGIAYMPLAQGLLTDKYFGDIPSDSRAAGSSVFLQKDAVTQEKILKAKALNEIAQERGQSLSQMALAWVLRSQPICSALIGASKISQIEENVSALTNLAFSAEELAAIEDVLNP